MLYIHVNISLRPILKKKANNLRYKIILPTLPTLPTVLYIYY